MSGNERLAAAQHALLGHLAALPEHELVAFRMTAAYMATCADVVDGPAYRVWSALSDLAELVPAIPSDEEQVHD